MAKNEYTKKDGQNSLNQKEKLMFKITLHNYYKYIEELKKLRLIRD